MQILPLTAQDKTDWQALWQSYQQFYQTDLPQATTDNSWQKIIDETSPIFGFGAWQNNKLVGIAHITLHAHTWTTKPCCYLIDLFVLPKIRGQGVGRALIEQVYQFAKDKNCNRVYWVTQESNVSARHLYDNIASKTDFVQYRHTL